MQIVAMAGLGGSCKTPAPLSNKTVLDIAGSKDMAAASNIDAGKISLPVKINRT